MKGKKKGLVVLLCLALLATMIAGCSVPGVKPEKKTESSKEKDKSVSEKVDDILQLTGTTDIKKTKKETAKSDETKNEDSIESKGTLSSSFEPGTRNLGECAGVTIEKQVLVDQNGIVISALEYVYDADGKEGIMLSVTNNTDSTISIYTDTIIVDNYAISSYFMEDVAAGETVNSMLEFELFDLDPAFVGAVEQVELALVVYDTNSCDEVLTTDLINIQTSAYANPDEVSIPEGVELYNEGGIKIIGMYVDPDGIYGTDVMLYVENTSDKNIEIEAVKVVANGVEMESWFDGFVNAGKKKVGPLELNNEEQVDGEVEKVEDVEVQFEIMDRDTYDIIGYSDTVKFNVD